MKFIKKYENFEDLSKYLIWQAKKIIMMILELTEIAPYHLKFKKLYTFNPSDKILKKIRNESIIIYKDYNKIKRHILYESYDLQSCLDNLDLILNTKKYNI